MVGTRNKIKFDVGIEGIGLPGGDVVVADRDLRPRRIEQSQYAVQGRACLPCVDVDPDLRRRIHAEAVKIHVRFTAGSDSDVITRS